MVQANSAPAQVNVNDRAAFGEPSYAYGKKPIIEIRDIWRQVLVDKTPLNLLQGINLNIYPGEYIMIFGRTGSGKTTLINQMIGLDRPNKGKVIIGGSDLSQMTPAELSSYRLAALGLVFQDAGLMDSLTVAQNIALPAILAGLPPQKRDPLVSKLLEVFHLTDIADKLPTNLSSGQKQKVAVARSLVNNPLILIADEPTGNLDNRSADDIMENIRFINEQAGMTTVVVSSNPAYVYYPHRVVYMTDGRIINIVENRPLRQR